MSITTLFTSLKLRKQHQVSINRSMDKEDVVYEVPHLAIKKQTNKILPFATIWTDLETIMLSEISQER